MFGFFFVSRFFGVLKKSRDMHPQKPPYEIESFHLKCFFNRAGLFFILCSTVQ